MEEIAILGFGESGVAAYQLLKNMGKNPYVFDDSELNVESSMFYSSDSAKHFYDFQFETVVVSPGIKKHHPFIQYALNSKSYVISELELGYIYSKCPIIAITGTNGKTTTVSLINKIMSSAGKKTLCCGNYGLPLSKAAFKSDHLDYLIVEASSFQLEFIDKFRPYIAAILNIGSDHIKWHLTKDDYRQAKLNIFKNQQRCDFFIKNEADDYTYNGKAQLMSISRNNRDADCFVDKNKVVVNIKNSFIIDNTKLMGMHNLENIACSAIVGVICGIDNKIIAEVSKTMNTLENRIEFVGELDGVKFYNDSKSTNIDSVVSAINTFDNNIVLILGGKHKGESFSKIVDLLQEKTRGVIVYGEDRKIFLDDLKEMIPIPLPAFDIGGALRGAFEIAKPGDVVLFSPGGSSFDSFNNYKERGDAFKKEFLKYKNYYESTPSK